MEVVMKCRKCESENAESKWREDRQQYETRCNDCNGFTWQPKIREDGEKKNREARHLNLVAKKGIEYCELCLRTRKQIPPPGTLEGHHILEYSEGGTDDLSNVLTVCTACHKLIHHQRTYLGHYK